MQSRILALVRCPEPHLADWGGVGVIALRQRGVLSDEEAFHWLRASPHARTAAARIVMDWLRDGHRPAWLLEWALTFAGDEEVAVADPIITGFRNSKLGDLLHDGRFVDRFLVTAGAQRHPEVLLEALDDLGNLWPLREQLLKLAADVVLQPIETADPWRRGQALRIVTAQLMRLLTQAEHEADPTVATRVLDALDALIEVGDSDPGMAVGVLSATEVPGCQRPGINP